MLSERACGRARGRLAALIHCPVSEEPHIHLRPRVIDLGRLSYVDAYAIQVRQHGEVLAARAEIAEGLTDRTDADASPAAMLLLVEHVPPVITVTRRPGAAEHLLASADLLADMGVQVVETDRGGDITYHGPGQLVVYPIVDLNRHRLRLHDYMRLLESAVIDTLAAFGVQGQRDPSATGVWVTSSNKPVTPHSPPAKICAMGVRVRQWVSMHGLALNVHTNLRHFDLIVPCGLHGRQVTSLSNLLGEHAPTMDDCKRELVSRLSDHLVARRAGTPRAGG